MCQEPTSGEENMCDEIISLVATLPPCDDELKGFIEENFESEASAVMDVVCYQNADEEPYMSRKEAAEFLVFAYTMYTTRNCFSDPKNKMCDPIVY